MTAGPLATRVDASAAMASLPAYKKLLLLAGNAIPLLQAAGLAGVIWWVWGQLGQVWWCVGAGAAYVYVLPVVLCRLVSVASPIRRQTIAVGSREFFTWWICLNLQMVFCRFPVFEEVLRLVPGCYSMWLRMWGSRVGRLTYWAAGVRVLDRQWLEIGDDVTFGAAVRLNPHVMAPDATGRPVLLLAPVTIGDRVSVGGYSLLVAGTVIAPDQCTRAFLILPPFSRLEEGHRRKASGRGAEEEAGAGCR